MSARGVIGDESPSGPGGRGGGGPAGRWTRRRLLASGLAGALGLVLAAGELVDHGVLPGRSTLEELTGGCSVAEPRLSFGPLGPVRSGRFFSHYRGREVGYSIAWPPGHGPGDAVALVISLHAYRGNHASKLGDVTLAQALAARQDGRGLPPMALAAVDGGGLYWNPHPGDDPLGMLVHELIPLCRSLGLGVPPHRVGTIGISMGGFGALLLAERYPQLIAAVAAISPAVWISYAEAHAANAGAFASAGDFAADDLITHAGALSTTPVRVASGDDDPFHPGVVSLIRALPATATVALTGGCHDNAFFSSQQHPSLVFLSEHLVSS